MNNKQENLNILIMAVKELFEGKEELSHMTGDIELCGKTADDAIRLIKEEEKKENENRSR